jgi:hypothetical protein
LDQGGQAAQIAGRQQDEGNAYEQPDQEEAGCEAPYDSHDVTCRSVAADAFRYPHLGPKTGSSGGYPQV